MWSEASGISSLSIIRPAALSRSVHHGHHHLFLSLDFLIEQQNRGMKKKLTSLIQLDKISHGLFPCRHILRRGFSSKGDIQFGSVVSNPGFGQLL